jgi:hypothetical protein
MGVDDQRRTHLLRGLEGSVTKSLGVAFYGFVSSSKGNTSQHDTVLRPTLRIR